MKLTVLGGGGVRAPYLAKTLALQSKQLTLTEICFMDINEEKLTIYGGLARAIAKKINPDLTISLTTSPRTALTDANYVITTLRVEGDAGRVFDEKLAQKYNILGQETTGIGGFAMALRSIPVLKEYLELARQVSAKGVLFFNFTNPSGLVTQALINAGYDNVYGICDGPASFMREIAKLLDVDIMRFSATCYGLNHLSFYRDFTVDGKDVSAQILAHQQLFKETEMKLFDEATIDVLQQELPNEYLYFYFNHQAIITSIARHGCARGETIQNINQRILDELRANQSASIEQQFAIFAHHLLERENSYFAIESDGRRDNHYKALSLPEFIAAPDTGGYSGIALNIIRGLQNKPAWPMTILVKNNDSIRQLHPDDVIEITCDMHDGKIIPRRVDDLPAYQSHIISTIKRFENLTIHAIEQRCKKSAIRALMVHPLINDYTIATQILNELLAEYQAYTGEWR
ncbi:glycoside hydrolase [Kluyvera sp. M-M157-B]|uniref:family 4 glycosyl hydrolase n=1 Tax=Kluyvera sp. M-M157-B TaxID=3402291 RepID=UPI003B25BB21